MTEPVPASDAPPSADRPRDAVRALLETHRVLESLSVRQQGPNQNVVETLTHRQNLVALKKRLSAVHPADLVDNLQVLPLEERELVWTLLEPTARAHVLLESPQELRLWLLEVTSRDDLMPALAAMDADDIAAIATDLPGDVLDAVAGKLNEDDRTWVHAQSTAPPDSVVHLMTHDYIAVRDTDPLSACIAQLRARGALPPLADGLFVVDARHVFRGLLSVKTLLLGDPQARAGQVMDSNAPRFMPASKAEEAAAAFDKYNFLSAPVVDERGKLVGCLPVSQVLDYIRQQSDLESLRRAGLGGAEDLFASVWESARNRWLWLGINVVTAFLASRVIGAFEASIEKLVALATLMPMVASIGGNTGNQTVALVIRAQALGHITSHTVKRLVLKEVAIACVNGLAWGLVMGVFAQALYENLKLSGVMFLAVTLNLLVAAVVGLAVPLLLTSFGRDPAAGSSVLLTFSTDSMGFFIFLGLATLFLL